MATSIQAEWTSFKDALTTLLPNHKGEFALWRGGRAVEFYSSYENAYAAGLDRFGLDAVFLVAQVEDTESTLPIAWQSGVMFDDGVE